MNKKKILRIQELKKKNGYGVEYLFNLCGESKIPHSNYITEQQQTLCFLTIFNVNDSLISIIIVTSIKGKRALSHNIEIIIKFYLGTETYNEI